MHRERKTCKERAFTWVYWCDTKPPAFQPMRCLLSIHLTAISVFKDKTTFLAACRYVLAPEPDSTPEVCPSIFRSQLMVQRVVTDAFACDVGVPCDVRHM